MTSCDESADSALVKIRFELVQDEDGWPPAGAEWLWARDLGDGSFELDNTPWFARDVSAGDVLRAEPDENGVLRFRSRIRESGSSTLRTLFAGDWAAGLDRLLPALIAAGAEYEGNQESEALAVHVPHGTPLRPLLELLDAGERDGWLGWETGHLSATHALEFEEWRRT